MAVYEYQAIAKTGKRVNGVIDADSPAAARRKLRELNMFPTNVAESFSKGKADQGGQVQRAGLGRISLRDVSLMTRQLAVLLQAGMPLVESLSALIEQTPNPRLKKVVYDVRGKVNEGMRLSDAMAAHKRVFSDLYFNMVGAGEASGALEQVLFRLADIQERQVQLMRRVQKSLAYPILMAIVGVGVVSFLMVFIVPMLTEMFTRQERELPGITVLLISISEWVGSYWFIIIIAILLGFVLWRIWVSRPAGRLKWDRFKLKLPLYGSLYLKLIAGRLTRTMGTMLSSGLTMMTALEVVKSVVGNRVIEEAMDNVKSEVRRGKDLAVPLREMNIFPPMMLSMIELGQRSGELESMLIKVADTYDDDVEITVETLVGLLEPLMILVMAVFVGFLVIAMLLPILDLSSAY